MFTKLSLSASSVLAYLKTWDNKPCATIVLSEACLSTLTILYPDIFFLSASVNLTSNLGNIACPQTSVLPVSPLPNVLSEKDKEKPSVPPLPAPPVFAKVHFSAVTSSYAKYWTILKSLSAWFVAVVPYLALPLFKSLSTIKYFPLLFETLAT